MNWKTALLGGIAFWLAMFIISFATGPVVHENMLDQAYRDTETFWRPELRVEPPDIGALMPRWIATGLITTIVLAAIYSVVQGGLSGPGWRKGISFGFICALFMCCFCAGWSGVFNLPDKIWIVWALESFVYYLPGGALLGWLHQRFFS